MIERAGEKGAYENAVKAWTSLRGGTLRHVFGRFPEEWGSDGGKDGTKRR